MSSSLPDPDAPGDPVPAQIPAVQSSRDVSLLQLLTAAVDRKASDLYITVGAPPSLRIDGDMFPIDAPPLTSRDTARLCQNMLSEQQVERFAASHTLRMSFTVRELARFRGSFFMQRGAMAGVYRVIPFAVPSLPALGLSALAPLASLRRGLVLVGGPLGSGKSTTIAALLATLAQGRGAHLVTIEDPIEQVFPQTGSSLVAQIEIGLDYVTFKDAFAAAMSQDPDVLMISELTGLAAIEGALEAAETGRLVIAASPSRSIAKAIARIVDAHPPEMQPRVRARLADVLEAVTCQSILPREPGAARRVTCELVAADASLRSRVRDGSALIE